MTRKKAREKILQILFEIDARDADVTEVLSERFTDDEKIPVKMQSFITEIVTETLKEKEKIDQVIAETLKGWDFKRIGKVEKSILRLAIYEMLYTDLSENIIINEAVELAKIFSTGQSASFINGILSKVLSVKQNRGGSDSCQQQ